LNGYLIVGEESQPRRKVDRYLRYPKMSSQGRAGAICPSVRFRHESKRGRKDVVMWNQTTMYGCPNVSRLSGGDYMTLGMREPGPVSAPGRSHFPLPGNLSAKRSLVQAHPCLYCSPSTQSSVQDFLAPLWGCMTRATFACLLQQFRGCLMVRKCFDDVARQGF